MDERHPLRGAPYSYEQPYEPPDRDEAPQEEPGCPQRAEKLRPVHPGEVLNEEFLIPMNITQYRLAKAIGVDARRIHSIVHGQRSITAETALLFSRFFGNSPGFWMGLQSQYDLETAEDRLSQRLEMVAAHSPASAVQRAAD